MCFGQDNESRKGLLITGTSLLRLRIMVYPIGEMVVQHIRDTKRRFTNFVNGKMKRQTGVCGNWKNGRSFAGGYSESVFMIRRDGFFVSVFGGYDRLSFGITINVCSDLL